MKNRFPNFAFKCNLYRYVLATTVYTCVYMHDWDRLEAAASPVLRAYFDAVQCSAASVRYAVSSADIYEEEDFLLATSGFDMGFAAIGDPERRDASLAGLRAAETWLLEKNGGEEAMEAAMAAAAEPEAGAAAAEAGAAAAAALLTRVRFRIALHTAMVHLFQKPSAEDAEAARACLDQAAAHLAEMKASLAKLPLPTRGVVVKGGVKGGEGNSDESESRKKSGESVKSGGGGVAADEGEALGGGDLDWDPNGLGFDRKVNLSKMGPAPPRVVGAAQFESSCDP
jgi:hypothetical protein